MGGLGLRNAHDHSYVAFASSYTGAADMMGDLLSQGTDFQQPQLSRQFMWGLQETLGRDRDTDMLTLEQIAQSTQKVWSLEVDLHRQSEFQRGLRMEGQNRDVVRVNALALPHAGDWLNAVPSTVYNLKMKTREFIPPVKFRAGHEPVQERREVPSLQ